MPPVRTSIKSALLAALWAVFCMGFFGRFPIPGFFADLYLMFLAALVVLSAGGYGSLLVEWLMPAALTVAERALFSVMAGFGLISLLMAAAGIAGLWTSQGAVVIVAGGLYLAWPHREKWALIGGPLKETLSTAPTLPLFLISGGALLGLLITLTPPTYYDSLVYHFALPQIYVHAGHWVGQPELIYSAFPQMMEMLWTLGILLAGDPMANVIGWSVAASGVFAVFLFAQRYLGRETAFWAAALLSTMPAWLLLSSGGYIDVGLSVFAFLSFYTLVLDREGDGAGAPALAGFFAGCALGTKYTGVVPLVIGIFLLIRVPRSLRQPKSWIRLAAYAGAGLITFSPWLFKNLHYVGNPVFPFLYRWSLKPLNPWVGDAAEGYFRGLTEYSPRPAIHLFKLLWDVALNGLNFGGGMDVLGDLGWAPLFAFLPALWLVKKRSPVIWLILFYGICFFIPWGMSRPVLRFLLPLAPGLAIAAAYGYSRGTGECPGALRFLGHGLLALFLLSNVRQFFDVSDTLSFFKVPLGFETREHYLTTRLSYFPAAVFVNTLPDNSLTYVVGDQRGYYYNKPVLVTPVFNKNPLTQWADSAASAEALSGFLKSRGITHILINQSELPRLEASYHLFPFTPKGLRNWERFLSVLVQPVYKDAHCVVMAIK